MEFTQEDLNKTMWVKPAWMEKNRLRWEVNANVATLWRLAVEVANRLAWKRKAHYCDFRDAWDFVVVQNIEKIQVTWSKMLQKLYYSYSGHKGHVKSINLQDLLKKNPEKALRFAVRWMLPKNKLRDRRMKRLKMFTGSSDKYAHFNPKTLSV